MRKTILSSLLLLSLFACQQDPTSDWSDMDLLSHGLPVSVQAPDSAEVAVSDMGVMTDVTVRSPKDDYYLQIYKSDASTNDIAKLKSDQISDVRSGRYFSRIVEEEEKGFLYEIEIDSSAFYNFRYVHVQGGNEILFQAGLGSNYNEEQARRLYQAVQQDNK